MMEPVSAIGMAIYGLVKSAPKWLPPILDAFLSKAREQGAEFAINKGKKGWRELFRLDEKEQVRHLQLAIKNAAERGLAQFDTQEERDLYRNILVILTEESPRNEALRQEAMRLFTLSDAPDFTSLAETYHLSQRISTLAKHKTYTEVDIIPYLSSFFNALMAELYTDPFFRQQMSDVLRIRADLSMQRSLTEVLDTLRLIYGTLEQGYTIEQFEKDVQAYTEHIERAVRYLKLVGVVPKERTHENLDPELDGIFVPLRIALKQQSISGEETNDSVIDALEQSLCLVLLGGPGSGKSTVTKHLAWSHTVANLPNSTSLTKVPLLPGKPLPLRIELRRLNEDRKQRPDYDFLTYASEVLLGRAGLDIPPQMFEILLERKVMLILLDGLDEVATIDDRNILVEEIESFAQRYPGNRFLVTSRPVGYDLAPLSGQSFSQAQIQSFDDQQIHMFLERWYVHVLRLSPLSTDDQQELETLHATLKNNPRLHSLAENPLLLTVITALHRYERLPDRRIQVYDRCADLLLETWAKLKGTNVRWRDLKLSKEDQYACVAHLGFVLHERSQEKQDGKVDFQRTSFSSSTANDVPSRFILREIERFLHGQNLFPSTAELNAQAKRFLELMQEEAGLIVERGTDEDGESLYGFVHRTFQEYFAAADVYERYQQEEDATIISKFLTEHLHDPHWSEVILLLLGKLKRKPATAQLRQILDGSTKSRLSEYTDILQQDLLFACTCLIEEIAVDSELAEYIVLQMSNLVKTSPFSLQRSEGLDKLSALIRTRQYSDLAIEALKILISKDNTLSLPAKINAAEIIYLNTHNRPDKRWLAIQQLLALAQQLDTPFEQSLRVVKSLYTYSPDLQKVYRNELQALLDQAQQTDNTFGRAVKAAQPQPASHENASASSSSAKESPLPELLPGPDLLHDRQAAQSIDQNDRDKLNEPPNAEEQINADTPFEQAILLARSLYELSSEGSYQKRRAIQMLLKLAQRPAISFDQGVQVAQALYEYSPNGSEEQWQANQILLHIAQGIYTPFKQAVQAAQVLVKFSFNTGQAVQILLNLAQQPGRTTAEIEQIAQFLYQNSTLVSTANMDQILLNLAQQPDRPIAEIVQIAQLLYQSDSPHATQILLNLMEQPDLSSEQVLWIVQMFIYRFRNKNVGLQARQRAIQMLWKQAHKSSASFVQVAWLAQTLYRGSSSGSKDQYQAVQILMYLVQRIDISIEQAIQAIQTLYEYSPDRSEERRQAVQVLLELAQRSGTSIEKTLLIILAFYEYSSEGSQEWRQASQVLLNLSEQPDISIEQVIDTAQTIYWISYGQLQKWQSAAQVLLKLTQRSDISTEQKMQIARSLYNTNEKGSELRQQAVEILLKSVQQSDLPPKAAEWIAWTLYTDYYKNKVDSSDIPHIAEIAKLEILSTEMRDEMFRILRNHIPQFGNVPVVC